MISIIVCRGFGSFGGGVHELPTFGYTPGAAPLVTIYCAGMYRPAGTESSDALSARTESADSLFAQTESADTLSGQACEQVQ